MMRRLIISLFAMIPTLAFAHSGHDLASLQAGFAHPFTGLDHLLVMVAIGVLACQTGGQARWQLPLMFVLAMGLGATLGLAHWSFLGVEWLIALSVFIMGVLLVLRLPMANLSRIAVVALFAIVHGISHGLAFIHEQAYAVLGGMLVATAILHGIGLLLGIQLRNQSAQIEKWLNTLFAGVLILVGAYFMVV